LQQWKVDVPWARAGQVVVANGGDLGKELGLWPEWAATPDAAPTFSANVVLGEPARGATVSAPLLLGGDARVFEAVVGFDLLGESGEVIASGSTMARIGAPDFGRFAAEVPFRVDRAQPAILRVYQPSARLAGELLDPVFVPLRLQP
jgi:hypothetical protein